MKKVLCLLLILVLTFGIAGCASPTTSDTGTEEINTGGSAITKKTQTNPNMLYDGVYYVGQDISAGKYLVKDVEVEYSTLYIVCYESRESYNAYKNENHTTRGEVQNAIYKHALYDINLSEGESGYLGLQDGNVLAVYYGNGTLRPVSGDDWYLQADTTLPTGVYFEGRDIVSGRYILTGANTKYSAQMSVFESMDKYITYHQTSRFTNGEETEALEKNAFDTQYVREGNTCSVVIREGGVLMIDRGEFSVLQS